MQIAACLGFTVFAVCSKRNFDTVKELGATAVIDYNEKTMVEDLVAAAKSAHTPIKFAYDTISEPGSAGQATAIVDAFGGGKLPLVQPFPPYSEDTTGYVSVELRGVLTLSLVECQKELVGWRFNERL